VCIRDRTLLGWIAVAVLIGANALFVAAGVLVVAGAVFTFAF
jgi:hypothetical protein